MPSWRDACVVPILSPLPIASQAKPLIGFNQDRTRQRLVFEIWLRPRRSGAFFLTPRELSRNLPDHILVAYEVCSALCTVSGRLPHSSKDPAPFLLSFNNSERAGLPSFWRTRNREQGVWAHQHGTGPAFGTSET